MKKEYLFLFAVVLLVASSCGCKSEGSKELSEKIALTTTALYETDPVSQIKDEDAADDPAIWIHPDSVELSRIIGTDKKGGLAVYDMRGTQLFYYPLGNLNNVDVRYDFPLNGDTIDIVAASNRSTHSITVCKMNIDGSIDILAEDEIVSSMKDEVYGFCLYKSPVSGKFYAFMNSKSGEVEQWELFATADSKIRANLIRSFSVNTQVEGMVADEENHVVFLGEEIKGIIKFDAEPTASTALTIIANSSKAENKNIEYDIEGLAIYYLNDGEGYLLASSQGNYSYAIFNRKAPHEYIGSFRVVDGVIDGIEETDGIEIYSYYINEDFQHGIFVAQDGFNTDDEVGLPQNFKYVPWENIAVLFSDTLTIN
ncbi:MAG: phytase [Prolixibacteraceae bacterium]|nr:phytase [Prolixibacteraceae bacterium]